MKILSTQSIEIIKTLTINHLKIKYKRTSLGFLWSLLNPLFTVGVISAVFSIIMGMKYNEFVIMFFPAFLAWNLFANSVLGATTSIINNESLIRKTPINIMIFPIVNICINFIEFLLTFFAFTIIAFLIGLESNINLLYIPLSIVLLMMFTLGISLLVSVISTYMRDMAYLIGVLLQLWFYLSPILYQKDFILGKYWLLDIFLTFNPIVYIVDMFRMPITHQNSLSMELLIIVFAVSICSLLLGIYVFDKNRYKLVYRL